MVAKKGGPGPDTLEGSRRTDTLVGEGGNDILIGNGGNDALYGGDGDDIARGGAGDDIVEGEDGNDMVIGGSGKDRVDGGLGNDTLNGAIGDDELTGGPGVDRLSGGSGADSFVFHSSDSGNFTEGEADTIVDFNVDDGDQIGITLITGYDGNTSAPVEGHYGVWFSNDADSWIVTYRLDGTYHDILTGDVNPTGHILKL
jgi:Ca2+-binding RTX toxin-like protein